MARLSIIIPADSGSELMEAGLVSVLQHRPAHSEVLVVLPYSYDDPYELSDEVQFVPARPGAGPAECIAAGLEVATGDVIHTLGAGLEVGDGWTAAPLARFADPRVATVAPLLVLGTGGAPLCSAGLSYSASGARKQILIGAAEGNARVPTLGPELRAGFYRRSALLDLGSLSKTVGDELADMDLALTLRAAGYRAVFEPASRIYAFHEVPPRRTGFLQGLTAERLFWRNAPLAGWGRALAGHPLAWFADVAQTGFRPALVTQMLGRMWACLEQRKYRVRHRQLAALQEQHAALEAAHEQEGVSLHRLRIDLAHRQQAEKQTESQTTSRAKAA